MKFLRYLGSRIHRETGLASAAEQLAERCFEQAWGRVGGQILVMAPAEAKGFVKARTAHLLQSAADPRQTAGESQQICTAAMDLVVRRVLDQSYVVRAGQERRAA